MGAPRRPGLEVTSRTARCAHAHLMLMLMLTLAGSNGIDYILHIFSKKGGNYTTEEDSTKESDMLWTWEKGVCWE